MLLRRHELPLARDRKSTHVDMLHLGPRWARRAPFPELANRLRRTFRLDQHGPVRLVPGEAHDPQAARFVASASPEEHALDPARDDDPNPNHVFTFCHRRCISLILSGDDHGPVADVLPHIAMVVPRSRSVITARPNHRNPIGLDS